MSYVIPPVSRPFKDAEWPLKNEPITYVTQSLCLLPSAQRVLGKLNRVSVVLSTAAGIEDKETSTLCNARELLLVPWSRVTPGAAREIICNTKDSTGVNRMQAK